MLSRKETMEILSSIDCSDDEKTAKAITRAMWSMTNAQILRNENCMKCGKYHDQHNGSCDGCRWKNDEVE